MIRDLHTPIEMDEAKMRLAKIRFDALVKIFDSGYRTNSMGKPLPPQWFVNELHLTLEFLEYADERAIGAAIKEAFRDLKHHIENYERQ